MSVQLGPRADTDVPLTHRGEAAFRKVCPLRRGLKLEWRKKKVVDEWSRG